VIDAVTEARPLPAGPATLLERLAALLGQERFVMFGGATLDLLQDPPRPARDLDIALPLDRAEVQSIRRHIAARGADVGRTLRRYWINIDQPVLMLDVRWEGQLIDLNFVDQIDRIPQFDIESVIWRYPELDYVDLYGAFDALATRTFRPVRGLAGNNPYLLLNRMIRLAAKYDLSLAANPVHQAIVSELSHHVLAWRATDDFHGRQAVEAHHRSIAGSVLRAQGPAGYLADLAQAGVLAGSLAELHGLLVESPTAKFYLADARTADEFWSRALALMPADAAMSLQAKLAAAARVPIRPTPGTHEDSP
jgi:hypothetical protein